MLGGVLLFVLPVLAWAQDSGEPQDLLAEQKKLYRINCALCHGPNGRGDGRAARFLFPKARDFTTGKMRIVSSSNRVASPADVRQAIENGVPGTSMQSWKELGDDSLKLLVAEVIRLREAGVRTRIVRSLQEDGLQMEPTSPQVTELVRRLVTPTETIPLPPFDSTDADSVERGRRIYLKQSCHSCHSVDGSGSWQMDLVDDKGRPSWAADLRYDPFKGGADAVSLARRIVLGMPGSAMPTSRGLSPRELADLVAFCQSLSREPKWQLTNYQRARRAEGFQRPAEPPESP